MTFGIKSIKNSSLLTGKPLLPGKPGAPVFPCNIKTFIAIAIHSSLVSKNKEEIHHLTFLALF